MSDPTPGGILIIGASGGIGSALATRLHTQGTPVTLAGRNADALAGLSGKLGGSPTHTLDATDPDAVRQAVTTAIETHGRLAGIAHLPGSLLLKPAHATKPDEWRQTMATNLDSAFYVVRAAAQPMCKAGGGSIVFLSSAVARLGFAAHEAIAAAKAGLHGLMLSAAASYASRGLRVNIVAPGSTETPLAAPILSNEASRKASLAMHPDGKAGTPEAVASAIAWLLDAEQWHVTGQTIGVDGGLGTVRSK
ncbi:MAG: SDR family oxidoreductase [Planctomycetota bacterium]